MKVALQKSCLVCNHDVRENGLIVFDGNVETVKQSVDCTTPMTSTSPNENIEAINKEESSPVLKYKVIYKHDLPAKLSRVLGVDMFGSQSMNYVNSVLCQDCFDNVNHLDDGLAEIKEQFKAAQALTRPQLGEQVQEISGSSSNEVLENPTEHSSRSSNEGDIFTSDSDKSDINKWVADQREDSNDDITDAEMKEIFKNVINFKKAECKMHCKMLIKGDEGTLSKTKCSACGSVFDDTKGFTDHIAEYKTVKMLKKQLNDGKDWCCVNNTSTIGTDSNGSVTSIHCRVCDKQFKDLQDFQVHIIDSKKKKDEALQIPARTKRNYSKTHMCELCGKVMVGKYSLYKRHVRDHTSKPFMCEICPKAFTRMSALEDHKRVHSGEKPFVCNVCGKKFRQKQHAKTHYMGVHAISLEKPELCSTCGKQFHTLASFKAHQKGCFKKLVPIEQMEQQPQPMGQQTHQFGQHVIIDPQIQQVPYEISETDEVIQVSQNNQIIESILVQEGKKQCLYIYT